MKYLIILAMLLTAAVAKAQTYVGTVGNVVVFEGYTGFYEVYSDPQSNADEDGIFLVININNANQSMQVNCGEESQTFYGLENVQIYGTDTIDGIEVYANAPWVDPFTSIYYDLSAGIHGRDGNDDLRLQGNGAIWGDAGNDIIVISYADRPEAYGGDGNDQIYIGHGVYDGYVEAGDGDDWVILFDCIEGTCFVNLGAGDDQVVIPTVYYGDGNIHYAIYGYSGHDICWGYSSVESEIYVEESHGQLSFPP